MPARHPARASTLRVTRAIVRWYLRTYYGVVEGPGRVPFYCDPAQVGAFAVDPGALATGDAGATFKLAVGLAMFQARRDVDIMAIQRGLSPDEVRALSDAARLRAGLRATGCPHAASLDALHAGCDVRLVEGRRADCSAMPGVPCPVKDASRLLGRYGDFGKMPASLALLPAALGARGWGGLPRAALRRGRDRRARAAWLEDALARGWRVSRKIATFILSALANPHLTPGIHPWKSGVDWTRFVVIDRHAFRVLASLGGPTTKDYDAHRGFLQGLARRIDLRKLDRRLLAYDPRLVQQAIFRFASAANRQATPQDCCHIGDAACRACPRVLQTRCPVARLILDQGSRSMDEEPFTR